MEKVEKLIRRQTGDHYRLHVYVPTIRKLDSCPVEAMVLGGGALGVMRA